MLYHVKMEVILIGATWTLCIILLFKILFRLRSSLLWRVNCWFCNTNSWVKYPEHNSWTCPQCEQYNGFTKDGDYNKTITTANDQTKLSTPRVFHKSPPTNGLCKMCNINQQLKVAQLANFVPMNENKFDEEIETYRAQLEKAYKLCSPCKKTLQVKLHKEKAALLGNKLLESRTPEKKTVKHNPQSSALKSFINNTSMLITFLLIFLVSYECYIDFTRNENLYKTLTNFTLIVKGLLDRVYSIMKMYMFLTFPSMESYVPDIHIFTIDMLPKTLIFRLDLDLDKVNLMTQKTLGGLVCILQIAANIWNVNSLNYTIIIDLLWSVFVLSLGEYTVGNSLTTRCIKITSILALLLVYRHMRKPKITKNLKHRVNKMKSSPNTSMNKFLDSDETTDTTDDDVSLSKFGVHNLTESSNEMPSSPLNGSLLNGRCFTPKSNSMWGKPKLNSTFCVSSMYSQSPSSVPETVFAKPSFESYQKLAKDDSDSDLDQSISCLSIGPTKAKKKVNPVFLLRKFTATPNFRTPMPTSRPLLSPSKLGHTASWVAGGYWGSDGESMAKQQNIVTSTDASRSSSQSSGFESQTSSMNQRNLASQQPSREPSVGVEPMVLDRFPNMSNLSSYDTPNNFNRISSPIFPQMQFNNHVHIPQAQFSQRAVPPSVYSQQMQSVYSHQAPSVYSQRPPSVYSQRPQSVYSQRPQSVYSQQTPSVYSQRTQSVYNHSGMIHPPGGTGLIKLPQVNTLSL